MAHHTRSLAPAIRTGVLSAIVTLALTLISGPAGAQDVWQDSASASPYSSSNAPAWYPPADRPQQELVRLPAVEGIPFEPPVRLDASVRPADYVPELNEAAEDLPPDAQFYTIDELRGEMKKLAWTKGEYTIVPYGMLWGSAIYATERCSPGSFVTHVFSETLEGEDDFVIDTRRTRLGFNVTGPDVPMFQCAKSSAQVEIDFYGGTGQIATTNPVIVPENRAGVLLRHAYAELKTDNWRLLAGQYWDLVSPLLPSTVNYSVGWGGGNIGFRRMQIRGERYLHFSDTCMLSVQGAVAQDIITDSLVLAETANWPVVQWRTGLTLGDRGTGGRPVTMGVSGHFGEQGFDFIGIDDDRIPTWSVNADCRVPIAERLGVQGEFFMGENLGTLLGGSLQGINPNTREPIQSTGGWFDVWYDWTPRLHTHFGYGIDNPQNSDIVPGGRTYNSFLFANVFLDVTKKLIFGFEVTNWNTYYQNGPDLDLAPGKAVVFEFTGNYGF